MRFEIFVGNANTTLELPTAQQAQARCPAMHTWFDLIDSYTEAGVAHADLISSYM